MRRYALYRVPVLVIVCIHFCIYVLSVVKRPQKKADDKGFRSEILNLLSTKLFLGLCSEKLQTQTKKAVSLQHIFTFFLCSDVYIWVYMWLSKSKWRWHTEKNIKIGQWGHKSHDLELGQRHVRGQSRRSRFPRRALKHKEDAHI